MLFIQGEFSSIKNRVLNELWTGRCYNFHYLRYIFQLYFQRIPFLPVLNTYTLSAPTYRTHLTHQALTIVSILSVTSIIIILHNNNIISNNNIINSRLSFHSILLNNNYIISHNNNNNNTRIVILIIRISPERAPITRGSVVTSGTRVTRPWSSSITSRLTRDSLGRSWRRRPSTTSPSRPLCGLTWNRCTVWRNPICRSIAPSRRDATPSILDQRAWPSTHAPKPRLNKKKGANSSRALSLF